MDDFTLWDLFIFCLVLHKISLLEYQSPQEIDKHCDISSPMNNMIIYI